MNLTEEELQFEDKQCFDCDTKMEKGDKIFTTDDDFIFCQTCGVKYE